MPTRDLTFAIVGSGGDGVITVGDMMAQAGAAEGLHVMKVEAYGPQIRGGESSCTVRLSADPIFAQGDLVQVLVVFNWADFAQFRGEIIVAENAVVLYEATDETPRDEIDLGPVSEVRWVPVPFIELAKESAGTTLAKNIVTIGLLGELFNLPKDADGTGDQQQVLQEERGGARGQPQGLRGGQGIRLEDRGRGHRHAAAVHPRRADAPDVGQRALRGGRAARRLPFLCRLPDHARRPRCSTCCRS